MELSDLVIRIIILLLPGLICMSLIRLLISKRKIDNREYIIYTIILSFTCYLSLNLITKWLPKINKITFFDALLDTNIAINKYEVFYASIIALVLGIILTIFVNKGLFYWLFRKAKITNRTGATSVWTEFIDDNGKGFEDYVYVVDFENDIVYGGQVLNYSNDTKDNIELVLLNVIVTTNSNRNKIIREMEKVYLKLPTDKIYIEVRGAVDGKENRKKRSKPKSIKTK